VRLLKSSAFLRCSPILSSAVHRVGAIFIFKAERRKSSAAISGQQSRRQLAVRAAAISISQIPASA